MSSRQAKIQEGTHSRIMRNLQDSPDLIQREKKEKVSMGVGGLYYCVIGLIDKGFVEMWTFSGKKEEYCLSTCYPPNAWPKRWC